jgi:NADH-quinone oxidoreductase subunit C
VTPEEARQLIAEDLGARADSVEPSAEWIEVGCQAASIAEVLRGLRDGRVGFDYFTFLTAVDYPPGSEQGGAGGRFELYYHLRSIGSGIAALVRTWVERDRESVRTVSDLYAGADWHERECYDLFGVVFAGHPDLTRILLPDEWHGHPLRKDYAEVHSYPWTVREQWPAVEADRRPEEPVAKKPTKEST